jgi:hypothetical protein
MTKQPESKAEEPSNAANDRLACECSASCRPSTYASHLGLVEFSSSYAIRM